MQSVSLVVFLLATIGSSWCQQECNLSQSLKDEIRSYSSVVDTITRAVIDGPLSGIFYDNLARFVDNFGPRQAGTENLELAIDKVVEMQQKIGLNVSTDAVPIPKWTRGEASAEVISPVRKQLNILTLGTSTSTPEEGITAKVVVVKDFDELNARKDEVRGNIVLYNAEFVSYGTTVVYRNQGPNEASKLGAVAALVRSITPYSLDSPHTGNTEFDDDTLQIPAAAITLENANFIARLASRGPVTVNFKSSAKNEEPTNSRNVIADIVGSTKPEEYVVISGHIDSWDVGQGALDDAGGAFLAWHSQAVLLNLSLPAPSRTIRSILWTAEENGLWGAKWYRINRISEAINWTIAIESDGGIFRSAGIGFSGSDEAACIMQEITALFKDLNATEINRQSSAGSDIQEFQDLGIPLAEPYTPGDNYFWYHHSKADWMDSMKREDLDQNLAIYAATTYILASLTEPLPKTST